MQAQRLHDTRALSRGEWLKLRQGGIGGSDAAAILGYNRYKSPYAVWADKLGMLPEAEDNEAMRQGRDFEEYVAKRWCEATGKRVRRVNAILRHPHYPWMLANIDRKVVGEDAGLECKTSRDIHMVRYRNGEFPEEYYLQCMHYLAVTGYKRWYLAVLVYGAEPLIFEIERDEADIAQLTAQEKYFWEEHIVKGIQPPTDGSQSTSDALRHVYADSLAEPVLECSQPDMAARYVELGHSIKALKEEREAVANALKSELGAHERMSTDRYLITWKPERRAQFDRKALLAEHPEIDAARYITYSDVRTFGVKEAKEA